MMNRTPYIEVTFEVVAVVHDVYHHLQDPLVKATIRRNNAMDYYAAAEYINGVADVVVLQHEFGIFGGNSGSLILCLINALE